MASASGIHSLWERSGRFLGPKPRMLVRYWHLQLSQSSACLLHTWQDIVVYRFCMSV